MDDARRNGGLAWEYVGIQALRAVAALAVVLGHSLNYLEHGNGAVPSVMAEFQGAVGVDLFFVISGFVMTISMDRLLVVPHPARVFLWRRFLRIAPLYWLLTAAKILLIVMVPGLNASHPLTAWNAVASFLFVPSANGLGEVRPVITLGWTLNFEMAFYLVFACALLVRRRFLWILLPAIGTLALLGFVRTAAWPVWSSLADPIVLEFLAGVLIARIAQLRRLPGRLVSGALVVAGAVGLRWIGPGLSLALRPVFWGVPAAMVVLGVVGLEGWLRRWLPRWVLLLGSASYSIYLIQIFVFPVVDMTAERVRTTWAWVTPGQLGTGVVVGSLVAAAMAGVATHLMVERPMTQMLKRVFGGDRIAPIVREG